jgi:general secretion pathway protein A
MYLNFYGFKEKPFNLTPDPRFVFFSRIHKEAFAHLFYGIENRVGFMALIGEVGSGKTTVLRTVLSRLDSDQYRTALILNPCFSGRELLQNINREFGLPISASSASNLLVDLNAFLIQENAAQRKVVLVIDEAQNLKPSVLEQIRLISNLETDREKLIQIVLAGQPEFEKILKKKEMRQLTQRITVQYYLKLMDFQDTIDYIDHRITIAGGKGKVIFSQGALKRIYKYSKGLPRLINVVCDRTLLAGYTRDTKKINSRIVAAGIKDIKSSTTFLERSWRLIIGLALAVAVAIFVGGIYFARNDNIKEFSVSQKIGPMPDQVNAQVGQVEKKPMIESKESSRAMVGELWEDSESESARKAFNDLADVWNVSPVAKSAYMNQLDVLEQAAYDRKLRLNRFSGNLRSLIRYDSPAMLELTVPGKQGKRFISLLGLENEQFLIGPPISGRKYILFGELEQHWSGQGFILWQDSLNLLQRLAREKRGEPVAQLQRLLTEAGAYKGPLTASLDGDTISAIKNFQSSKGIAQDGIAGSQTLLLLYQASDRFKTPKLTAGQK